MSSKEHCRFAAVAGSPGAGIVVDSSGSSIAVHESPITPPHLEEAAPAYSRKDLLAARYRVARVLPYQQASPPFISNLALAVFSGLLLVFAFPDWNLWSLGWVGTAPLIMALVRERRFWRGLALGWTTGIIFFAGTSYWVTYSMHHYGGVPLGLSYALMMVLAAILSSFTGLFAGVFGLAVKRLGGWAIISAPILWAASEYARILVTGVGWNALGYSQAFQPAVIQVSSWGGVYLVTAIMVFAATALVFGMVYLELRRGLLVLTVAGLIAVLSVLYGESLRPTAEGPHSINALAVQPVIPIEGDWEDRRFFDQMFERQRDMSTQTIQSQASANDVAAEQKKIDVVIWPESPINFQYDRDTQLRKEIESFAIEYKVYVLFNSWGFPQNNESADAVYNSAIVVDPSGQKTSEYDKLALVPFGEYVPARGIIPFIDRIPALVADVTAGSKLSTADAAGAKLGTLICFEVTRPDLARQMRREGASVLVQLSNETWFGPTAAAHQMLSQCVFRAVENNTELVRATNSGASAKIDRFGLVSGETSLFEPATRVWGLQSVQDAGQNELTFYSRHGDVFAAGCLIASVAILVSCLAVKTKF